MEGQEPWEKEAETANCVQFSLRDAALLRKLAETFFAATSVATTITRNAITHEAEYKKAAIARAFLISQHSTQTASRPLP